jgi:hypothetical protein
VGEQRRRGLQRQIEALKSPENGQKGAKAGDLLKERKAKGGAPRPGDVLLKDFLNSAPPLYRLASVVNGAQCERPFGKFYAEERGRPALATRLVVGLHSLQDL